MADVGLLPCPFCGGRAVLHESRDWIGAYSLYCAQCGATVGEDDSPPFEYGTTAEQAVATWNRRDGCNLTLGAADGASPSADREAVKS